MANLKSCAQSPSLPYLQPLLTSLSEIGDGDPQPGCHLTRPAVPCPSTPPERWIELSWPVMGDRLRADHNYRLYSALIERLPVLKDCDWQLKTINGIPDGHGWVKLGRQSRLGVRCDLALLEAFGALDNQVIRVGAGFLELGTLSGQSIQPKPNLSARLVTFKSPTGCFGEYEFGISLGRVLREIGLQKPPKLGSRKTLKIKGVTVAGYALHFENVLPEYSLWLQRYGIGGRRKMGCGVFE